MKTAEKLSLLNIDTTKFTKEPAYPLGTQYIDSAGRKWTYVKKQELENEKPYTLGK